MSTQIRRIRTSNDEGNTASFFSLMRRTRYNLSKLHKELTLQMRILNMMNSCHLTAYPYIAVHVSNRDHEYLRSNCSLIKERVEAILFEMMD